MNEPREWCYVNGRNGRNFLLGEDERGDLWVPSRWRAAFWDRRLNLRRPTHWPYWLHSKLTNRVVMLELSSRSAVVS